MSSQFSLICEAYDVLSSEQTKNIFDEFGERGLWSGVPKKFTGYAFSGDCYKIFKDFFGSYTPHQILLEKFDPEIPICEENDLEIVIQCTLKEFYNGCIKQI